MRPTSVWMLSMDQEDVFWGQHLIQLGTRAGYSTVMTSLLCYGVINMSSNRKVRWRRIHVVMTSSRLNDVIHDVIRWRHWWHHQDRFKLHGGTSQRSIFLNLEKAELLRAVVPGARDATWQSYTTTARTRMAWLGIRAVPQIFKVCRRPSLGSWWGADYTFFKHRDIGCKDPGLGRRIPSIMPSPGRCPYTALRRRPSCRTTGQNNGLNAWQSWFT